MTNLNLSIKVGVIVCLVSRFIWWIGGADIFERTPTNAAAIGLSLLLGLAAWALCMGAEVDKDA